MRPQPIQRPFFSLPLIPCGTASCGVPCRIEACARATKTFEAIRLIQLGARITLICQLTGIEKTVAKRLYRELTGTSPPPGQTPFTDAWYVESDLRMLQAAIVWRLYECLDRPGRSKARVLIYVYEAYRQLVRKPVLDLIRVAYVPRLVAMRKWQERLCEECHLSFLRPVESLNTICPGCRLYHRYRCRRCDTPLHVRPRGRRRWVCAKCRGVAIRKV